jgi:hypothetical protein
MTSKYSTISDMSRLLLVNGLTNKTFFLVSGVDYSRLFNNLIIIYLFIMLITYPAGSHLLNEYLFG